MKDAFLRDMKTRLEKEHTRLTNELANLAKQSHTNGEALEPTFPDHGDTEDENAAEVAQFTSNISLEEELAKALRDVEGALALMEKGAYGICKYCNQPIDERRLEARPTSSSCIQCKKTFTQEV